MGQAPVTFALAIPHTPWRPERVKSLARLVDALTPTPREVVDHRVFADRAANHEWSASMWGWGAETDATHFVSLQDDCLVAPNFWAVLVAMLEAVPRDVIGLEVVHPAAPALAREGHRWFTTSDLLVGVGYVVPRPALVELLAWRAQLRPGAVEAISEDTLLALFCVATGRRIYHPLPTIIDHDTTLPSTYGNDAHPARRPLVRWDNSEEEFLELLLEHWESNEPPPHLGRFWDLSPLGARWVPGWTDAQGEAYRRDDGHRVKRKLAALERAAAAGDEPKARLLLCTPARGGCHPEYVSSVLQLATQVDLDVEDLLQLAGVRFADTSVVVARARMIRYFLATDCTHLLFVDADVSFDPAAVYGMLASGHDFVQTPYPRRGEIDWRAVAREGDERPIEARGHRYSIRSPRDWALDAHHCVEIFGTGLGLTLLSRACLERMALHYAEALTVTDDHVPTVMLTALMMARDPDGSTVMLSEDYSLCERWRQMGGRVHLFVGQGSPATHHGDYACRGAIESLGLKRIPK